MTEERLRIAFPPGVSVGKWTRIFAERHPLVGLDVERTSVATQRMLLTDGAVDLCFVRLPIDQTGLHVIPLYVENVVVTLHEEHILTLEKAVTLGDLDGLELIEGEPDEKTLRAVAAAGGIAIMPASIAKALRRRDVVALVISDAAPAGVALAWAESNHNPFVEEFIGIVRGRTANSSRGREPAAAAVPARAAPRKPATAAPAKSRRRSPRKPRRR